MTLQIRRLTGRDTQGFRALRLAGLKSDPKAFGSDYATECGMTEDDHRRRIENGVVIGGFDGDTLIAAVGYDRPGQKNLSHRGHVWGMIVAQQARGQGVGRAVLSTLIAEARSAGLRQLHLGVGAYNIAAIHLYKGLGFCTYGTEPRALHIDNQDIDEHLMVLFLDKED